MTSNMKILAFGASSSKHSINKELTTYTAQQFNLPSEILDLNDFEMPLFSIDREKENGFPPQAQSFLEKIQQSDLVIISFAEHNGSYSAAFKNIFDWVSRIKVKMFEDKKLLLLSTSTGMGAGRNALNSALLRFPKHGGDIIAAFSLPNFKATFSSENGIIDPEYAAGFSELIKTIKEEHVQHITNH